MEKFVRGIIALVILLSGVALLPFVEMPTEALTWQMFAGIYDATLSVNYTTGQPGSYFTFAGAQYPANSMATLSINGNNIGQVETDNGGNLTFILYTGGVDPGIYSVTATVNSNASATAVIELLPNAPLRLQEGSGPIFAVSPIYYAPIISKASS